MKRYAFLLVFILLISAYSCAAVPRLLTVQGRLKENDVLANGSYDITFYIYDTASGGTPLWQETHTNVSVDRGYFSVVLGETNPINLDFKKQYWLTLKVEDDTEMTPRIKLTNAGYAFVSIDLNVQSDLNIDSGTLYVDIQNDRVGIGTTSPSYKLDVAGQIHATGDICTDEGGGKCLSTASGGTSLWTDQGTYIYPNNYTSFVITDDGNVGIGDTSPDAKLDVEGSAIVTGDLTVSGGDVIGANSKSIDIGEQNTDSITFKGTEDARLVLNGGYTEFIVPSLFQLNNGLYVNGGTAYFNGLTEHRGNINLRDSPTDYIYSSGGTRVRIADDLGVDGQAYFGGNADPGGWEVYVNGQAYVSDYLRADGGLTTDGTDPGTGNIRVSGAIVAPEGTLRDDGGGWVRTYGATGWYSQTYGGGWYMTDTSWLRAYNNKGIYTAGQIRSSGSMRAPIFYDHDNTGYYLNPASTSVLNTLDIRGNVDVDGTLTKAGNTVWHAGNDGSGSGLDADMLDGYHASSFAKSLSCTTIAERASSRTCNTVCEASGYICVSSGGYTTGGNPPCDAYNGNATYYMYCRCCKLNY